MAPALRFVGSVPPVSEVTATDVSLWGVRGHEPFAVESAPFVVADPVEGDGVAACFASCALVGFDGLDSAEAVAAQAHAVLALQHLEHGERRVVVAVDDDHAVGVGGLAGGELADDVVEFGERDLQGAALDPPSL